MMRWAVSLVLAIVVAEGSILLSGSRVDGVTSGAKEIRGFWSSVVGSDCSIKASPAGLGSFGIKTPESM